MKPAELIPWLDQRISAVTRLPFNGARPEHFITRQRGVFTLTPAYDQHNVPHVMIGLNGLAFLVQGAN